MRGYLILEKNDHDLRHTFVCHRLNQWASNEVDLTAMLPILSKYLGHTSISATSWYLRLTAEAYPGIVYKMDCFVYIRDLLGHTDLRTTEIYARAETKAKREALEAASPIRSESQFPSWTDDNSLISWLQSFGHSNS